MSKPKRPDCYRAPLKSRAAITAWLLDHESYHGREGSPLAWNVKDYGSDLGLDNLIRIHRESGYYPDGAVYLDDPQFLAAAESVHTDLDYRLWDYAVEDARRGLDDGDGYRTLWDGTELDVTWSFAGRSGGWLVLAEYQGVKLHRFSRSDWAEYLAELDYAALRTLYQFAVQCDADFSRANVKAEIEYCAAFTFFENLTSDIVRPDAIQRQFAFAS